MRLYWPNLAWSGPTSLLSVESCDPIECLTLACEFPSGSFLVYRSPDSTSLLRAVFYIRVLHPVRCVRKNICFGGPTFFYTGNFGCIPVGFPFYFSFGWNCEERILPPPLWIVWIIDSFDRKAAQKLGSSMKRPLKFLSKNLWQATCTYHHFVKECSNETLPTLISHFYYDTLERNIHCRSDFCGFVDEFPHPFLVSGKKPGFQVLSWAQSKLMLIMASSVFRAKIPNFYESQYPVEFFWQFGND